MSGDVVTSTATVLVVDDEERLRELLAGDGVQALELARALLLEQVWGADYFGDDHVVDVHVANLRKKPGDDPAQPRLVETVRGVGYRLKVGVA